jgi:hypothetical protein
VNVPVRTRQGQKPKYIARAKVGNGWQTIGACWELRSGEEGLSVKLNAIPVGEWNGQFVLLPPIVAEQNDSGG